MAQNHPKQDPITQLIEAIGARNMQCVLETLGAPDFFTTVELPPSRKLNAMLYRKVRNEQGVIPC